MGNMVVWGCFTPCFFGRIWRSREVAKELSGGKSGCIVAPPSPTPHSSLPKPLSSCVLMTHGLVGEAGRTSLPCRKDKVPCGSSLPETPSPDHRGRPVPWGGEEMDLRGGLESRPWVGQPGETRGTRHPGSLADCISPSERLGLLSYALLGERV